MHGGDGEVVVDEPGEIDDVRLRWENFLPVLAAEVVEIEGDRGHLDGLFAITKVAEPLRKFLE
jgi:hypothetical protein